VFFTHAVCDWKQPEQLEKTTLSATRELRSNRKAPSPRTKEKLFQTVVSCHQKARQ